MAMKDQKMAPTDRPQYSARLATPFAVLDIRTRNETLVGVHYLPLSTSTDPPRDAFSREVCNQIRAYLKNALHRFDIACALEGTAFQQRVWEQIARIPARETRTYGDLARALGSSPRAVGGACGSNPVPLIVPCHRVLSAGGGLGGFMHSRAGFPLGVKTWLLDHEGIRPNDARR
jgi:methylated-DNA-[protein]-cysteine S-methyltransferase